LVEPHSWVATFEEFIHMHQEIRDRITHDRLEVDLIKHQWTLAETAENNE
jgi:hypothetical protein